MDEQFQDFFIFEAKFSISKLQDSKNLFFFRLEKFQKFSIKNIPKTFNLEIPKISKILEFQKFPKLYNFKNRKIFIFDKFIK